MSDTDQVLAKVRAAATRGLENMTCLCVGEGGRTPVATCKHCHGSGYLVTDETICARAALAMVEQYEWHRDTAAKLYEHARGGHLDAMARILSALRTAVGE